MILIIAYLSTRQLGVPKQAPNMSKLTLSILLLQHNIGSMKVESFITSQIQ